MLGPRVGPNRFFAGAVSGETSGAAERTAVETEVSQHLPTCPGTPVDP